MARAQADDDFVAEINVTPFVDVMLVLLIIFMVTAPMMTEGLDVSLPKVETSEMLPTDDDKILLTVKTGGVIFLNQHKTVVVASLAEAIASLEYRDKQIFVRADKDVPYGKVMEVMDRLRGAGMTKVGLVTVSSGLNQNSESSSAGP